MPDKELVNEYARAKDKLEETEKFINEEKDKLKNLDELESVLKEIEIFQIPDKSNNDKLGYRGGANLVQVGKINIDKRDVTQATVSYQGSSQGLKHKMAKYFVRQADGLHMTRESIDKTFNNKTIISGLGTALRSRDGRIKKNAETALEMWNGFSDADRKGVDVFNVKGAEKNISDYATTFSGGYGERMFSLIGDENNPKDYVSRTSSFSILIQPETTTDQIKTTMLHEKSHKVWHDMVSSRPKKIAKFTKDVIALGEDGAITEYALKHYRNYEEKKKEIESLDTTDPNYEPISGAKNRTMNRLASLYANEFHSCFMGGIVSPTSSIVAYHDLNVKNLNNANDLVKELYNDDD